MKISMSMAGYDLGQADKLRKAIGRKEVTKIDAAVNEFRESCRKNGFTDEQIEPVAIQIKNAGSYVFNRSHAISYSLLSYITCYLKTHYPAEFLAETINSKNDQDKTVAYVNEAKRLGIKVLPPDYSVGNREWIVENGAIRVGLTYIKGVGKGLCTGETTFTRIIRANNKRICEALIKAGALDFLGKTRGWMLSNLAALMDTVNRKIHCAERIDYYMVQRDKAVTDKEKAKAERMIESWKTKMNEAKTIEQAAIKYDNAKGEMEVLSFSFTDIPKVLKGKAVSVYELTTKNGNKMALVTFDTDYGEFKGSVAPFLWNKKVVKGRYGTRKGIIIEQGKDYEFMLKKNGQYTDIVDCNEV